MKKTYIKKNIVLISSLVAGLSFVSCNTFLDKDPDNRLEIRTPDDATKLLVSAYPEAHPAYLLEMYSDNTDELEYSSWSAADRFQEQAYKWEDITETHGPETPQTLWNKHYIVVTTANEVLKHIASVADKSAYRGQIAEAKLCRAYAMFQLANVFCQAYSPETAKTDLGLPYPTMPEDRPGKIIHKRGTLEELYKNIEKDLTEGISDLPNNYRQPKFHFNTQAAHAFAARFYLYAKQYEKAIEHADRVLGTSPAGLLRNWNAWSRQPLSANVQPDYFVQASQPANLFLQVVVTEWGVISIPTLRGAKYAHGEFLSTTETLHADGPWGTSNTVFNYVPSNNSGVSKYAIRKFPFKSLITDRQAGTGVPYSEYAVFTTDETLLVRAEAKAMLGRYEEALADLNLELSVFSKTKVQLTLKQIQDFYKGVNYYTPKHPTVKKAIHTTPALEAETQEPLMQAILQLRRIITLHDGLRLQDVKRYGITIYRRQVDVNQVVTAVTDSLPARDPRLAIQIPQDVIIANLEANPRVK